MKRVAFLVGTALLGALFVLSMWQDMNREWAAYQRQFLRSLHREERRAVGGGIKQFIVPELRRVDRCTTCHLAIQRPQLALAEQPFTAHPGEYLTWHPPEQFGCTVCHGGQGLATEVRAAHGEVKHWEKPLLRGALAQASCRKCHGDLQAIESHVPRLTAGIQLYKRHGCAGCHAVHGFGQAVSVDLSDVADKSWQLVDFTFVEAGGEPAAPGRHEATHGQWIFEHFIEPRKITPGFRKEELPVGEEEVYPTFMPNYGLTNDEATALTIYMLSLTAESLPANYVVSAEADEPEPVSADPVERGRAVFNKFGCVGCHGQGAMGGRKNFNAQLGQEIPSLVYVKASYDRESVKQLIRDGRQPAPRLDGARPRPPVYMPAWKGRIPEDDLDALVDYLFSLYDQVPQPAGQQVSRAE